MKVKIDLPEGGVGLRILDIGCGNNKYPGAVGLDIRKDTDANITYDMARVPYPFKDGVFDAVTMRHSLEHIPRPVALYVLDEIYRLLKQDGTLLVDAPIGSNFWLCDLTHVNPVGYIYWQHFDESIGCTNKYVDACYELLDWGIGANIFIQLAYKRFPRFTEHLISMLGLNYGARYKLRRQ